MPIRRIAYVRLLWFLFLLLGIASTLEAQNRVYEEDVLYLKNGSVLRGEIIEYEVKDYVKIRLREGTVFSYKTSEIEKITREASKFTQLKLRYRPGLTPIRYMEEKKFYPHISYAFTFNETGDRILTNFSTHLRTLYNFDRRFQAGLGTGFDFYEGGLVIPAFVEIQGDILKTRATPFYLLQGGYGFGTGGTRDHIVFDGGLMAHAALGLHWYTANRRSYYVSLGFKIQNTYQEFREFPPNFFCCGFPGGAVPDPPLVIGTRRYQKIVLQFGYNF